MDRSWRGIITANKSDLDGLAHKPQANAASMGYLHGHDNQTRMHRLSMLTGMVAHDSKTASLGEGLVHSIFAAAKLVDRRRMGAT
eukprot:8934763-Alexandrium_andersonii.AAC.2